MKVHVKNLPKYQAEYKDGRKNIWTKIYYDSFDSDDMPENEIDRYRFWSLCVYENYKQQPTNLTPKRCAFLGWNLKKRSISLTLQMLHTIIKVCDETVTKSSRRGEERRGEEKREEEKRYMSIFNSSVELFPGIVRGVENEFANFIYHCEHPLRKLPVIDWKVALPLLLPAVEGQIARRKKTQGFVPPWKNFQTWINNRCWEDVQGGLQTARKDKQKALDKEREEIRQDMGGYYRGRTKEQLEIHRKNPYNQSHWFLIDEILKER